MTTDTPAADVPPDLTGKTVLALDTLSRVYQLFHALPEMTAPDGTPVSVIFGLTRDLLDIIEKKKPDYLLCAMDPPGPTFRHEMFEQYKANRAEMPADLVPQIPLVRRLLEVFGIPCLELPGFEADDVLATIATRTVAAGGDCTIATSDKDARQLLGPHVTLLNLRTNQPLGSEELLAEWSIRPDQVVDFLSLVGDAVDNVPGVPGIGPKIASELLQAHGTLDGLLANIDAVSGAKRKENLRAHGDTARAGRELIRLETNVPIDVPWRAAALHQPRCRSAWRPAARVRLPQPARAGGQGWRAAGTGETRHRRGPRRRGRLGRRRCSIWRATIPLGSSDSGPGRAGGRAAG